MRQPLQGIFGEIRDELFCRIIAKMVSAYYPMNEVRGLPFFQVSGTGTVGCQSVVEPGTLVRYNQIILRIGAIGTSISKETA